MIPDPVVHALYCAHPKPDYYFAFWPESFPQLLKNGVPESKIIQSGPLSRLGFYDNSIINEKNTYKQKLREAFHVEEFTNIGLITAGAAWIFRSEDHLDVLLEAFNNENVLFVFVCGNNSRFRLKMTKKYRSCKIFKFLGWLSEEEMVQWMKVSDFIIAFTLAQMSVEAGLMGLPIYIFNLIEGQEERYRDVIENRGVGMFVPGKPDTQVQILKLLYRHSQTLFGDNLSKWQNTLRETPGVIKKILANISDSGHTDK